MRAHAQGDVSLVTSFLTFAEAVAVNQGESSVPQDIQDRFRRLLTSGQYVSLLAPTPKTGIIAQDLRWKHGIVLRGPDALHVAFALEGKCSEFLTTDAVLQKDKIAAALPKLRNIGLSLISAGKTANLSDDYRQGDMLGKTNLQ
jgi:predicted nucleic acid-binding protein